MSKIEYHTDSEVTPEYEVGEGRFCKTVDAVLFGALPAGTFSEKESALYFNTVDAEDILTVATADEIDISWQDLEKLVKLINLFEIGNLPSGRAIMYDEDSNDYYDSTIYCSWSHRGTLTQHDRVNHQAELLRLLEIHFGAKSAAAFFLPAGDMNPHWKQPAVNLEPLHKLVAEFSAITLRRKKDLLRMYKLSAQISGLTSRYHQL